MLKWVNAGWEIAEFSSRVAVFFCTKGAERRQVEITPTPPQGDYRAGSHFRG